MYLILSGKLILDTIQKKFCDAKKSGFSDFDNFDLWEYFKKWSKQLTQQHNPQVRCARFRANNLTVLLILL